MTPFRQLIRQGQSGADVLAVKRTMVRMHVAGSGGMITSGKQRKYAGNSFTNCIKRVQRNHKIRQDGIYGKGTHEVIAPHFSKYEVWLYKRATMRQPPRPAAPQTAQAAAKRLVELANAGKFRDDRGTVLAQIKLAAAGKSVWSPLGKYVQLDDQMLKALVYLIDKKGHTIGCFAVCSDHHPDSERGHAGGHSVDISSIDGVSILSGSVEPKLVQVLKDLRNAKAPLKPWQLISGGYANHRDPDCSALSMPAADAYYGSATMLQHCNHIHLGY